MCERIRVRILQAGDVVTVHSCAGAYIDLPTGLPEGARVTIVRVGYGYAQVRSSSDQLYTLAFPQIQMPCSVWCEGKWIDRSTHPMGERAYLAALSQPPDQSRRRKARKASEGPPQ